MNGFPWGQLSAELWLCLLGIGLLLASTAAWAGRAGGQAGKTIAWLAIVGLLLGLVPALGYCAPAGANPLLFGGLFAVDRFQIYFRVLVLLQTVLVLLISLDYLERIHLDRGVYSSLLVFGALAMCLLAGSRDLVMVYLSIEYLSITSYLLAAYLLGHDVADVETTRRSLEAGLKYLIYGAVASAVMVYGFSLMYGLAGSTSLEVIGRVYGEQGNLPMKLTALVLALAGLTFKIAAVPFWQWAPDVYEGAPTPVAAFLAVGSKSAGFAVLVRFVMLATGAFDDQWRWILALVAVSTMFVGNLLALLQTNLKRLLAYSGIAHAGYLLVGLAAGGGSTRGIAAMLLYLAAYLLMTMGLFAAVVWLQRTRNSEEISGFAGLARSEPGLAVAVTVLLLSLTGIPPTAGFVGKLHLLLLTTESPRVLWLGVMILVNSAISLYYYWAIARSMWLAEPRPEIEEAPPREARWAAAVIYVCAVLTVLFGVQFGPLLAAVAAPLAGP